MTENEQDKTKAYINQLAQDCELMIDNFFKDDKVTDPEQMWIIKVHVISKFLINVAFNRNQDNAQVRKWFRDHWVPRMIKRINHTEITAHTPPPDPLEMIKNIMKKGSK